MRNIIVIIGKNAYKYGPPPTSALITRALDPDGRNVHLMQHDEYAWSGVITPGAMNAECFAADRALHALHNDGHLAAFGEEMRKGMINPGAAWPFPERKDHDAKP